MAGISGSRRARSSLLVLVPLAVALGACGGTSGGGGGTKSEVDAGGTGSDAGGDAGSSALGFTPSNIGAALSGVDLTKLEDVSWTLKFKPEGLYSDSDTTTRVAKQRGGVVFVEVPQPNGTKVGVNIAKSWRIEEGSLLAVNGKQPMALVAIDTITVLGGLRADADGFDLGAGGFSTDVTTSGMKGGGPGGGAPATASGSTREDGCAPRVVVAMSSRGNLPFNSCDVAGAAWPATCVSSPHDCPTAHRNARSRRLPRRDR